MNQLVIKKKDGLNQKKKKGFTLIELIIVIAIIAILAALAIPKFGEVRENANQKADIATAKNMATIIAQEIANESNKTKYDVSKSGTVGTDITDKLDGNSSAKSKKAGTAKTFSYVIDATGNITIWYTGANEVYPNWDATVQTPSE